MEKKEQTNNKWGLRTWEFVGNMGRMLQNTRKSRSKIMIPECKTWSTQHLRMFLLQLCFSSCVSRRFLLLDLDPCVNCKTGPCAKTSSMLEWASQLIKYWTYRIYLASSTSLLFLSRDAWTSPSSTEEVLEAICASSRRAMSTPFDVWQTTAIIIMHLWNGTTFAFLRFGSFSPTKVGPKVTSYISRARITPHIFRA